MQVRVHDVTITKSHKNVFSSFPILNIFLNIFALNSHGQSEIISNKYYAILRSVAATAVLGSINFYTLYFKVSNIYDQINVSIKFTDAVQMVYDFGQYTVDLIFVYHYGREKSVEYFQLYGTIDKILGVTYNCVLRGKLVKLSAFFLCLWLLSSVCDFAAWVMSFGWIIPTMYSVAYIYFLIKILTTLDLSAHALNIECRLQSICDVLQNCYNRVENAPGVVDYLHNKDWLYSDACPRVLKLQMQHDPNKITYNISRDVKSLTRCYLMLLEQVAFINQMFGIRILLNMLSFLIDMIRFTNIAVRILVGSQQTEYDSAYIPGMSSTLRLLACVAVLVGLAGQCESVYRRHDHILNVIDHLLVNKTPSDILRNDATELRDLVQSRPIRFNMANFFSLNYSLLISLTSVVVTYTIIILQSVN